MMREYTIVQVKFSPCPVAFDSGVVQGRSIWLNMRGVGKCVAPLDLPIPSGIRGGQVFEWIRQRCRSAVCSYWREVGWRGDDGEMRPEKMRERG